MPDQIVDQSNVLSSTTLRPGLLVGLKTSITGNVTYKKRDLGNETVEGGAAIAKWETERTIADLKEHEEAGKARGKARSMIAGVCAQSAFGLLCPEDKRDVLEQAVYEARKVVGEFNARASITKIELFVITGRIAPDDAEAIRAINNEMTELMNAMERGLARLDVEAVREAASKARSVGRMLSPAAQEKVKVAVEVAREAARKIIKAGESASAEIDQAAIRKISEQRTAFLDIGSDAAEIAAPEAQGRAVDLEARTEIGGPSYETYPLPQIEIEGQENGNAL